MVSMETSLPVLALADVLAVLFVPSEVLLPPSLFPPELQAERDITVAIERITASIFLNLIFFISSS